MYLIALIFPGISFLIRGHIFTGIFCVLLQFTIIGWFPASIWALFSLNNARSEKRHQKIVALNKNIANETSKENFKKSIPDSEKNDEISKLRQEIEDLKNNQIKNIQPSFPKEQNKKIPLPSLDITNEIILPKNIQTPPLPKEQLESKQIQTFFSEIPNLKGTFELEKNKNFDTLYQFEICENEGLFEFIGNNQIEMVINNHYNVLDNCCVYTAFLTNAKSIKTIKKGKVVKTEDNKWKTVEKALIEFIV